MNTEHNYQKSVDTCGEACPFPWVHAKKALKKIAVGEVLRVVGDHGPALKNIPRNFTDEGHSILKAAVTNESEWEIMVRREK